jgi:hypothetical protein
MGSTYEPTWRWHREPSILWLDHILLKRSDLPRLQQVQVLKCWAVRLEDPAMLAELPSLWWLDWRGGNSEQLPWIASLEGLKYVQIWHAYKLQSVRFLAQLPLLQAFMLHACPRVRELPDLRETAHLHTVELSTMKALSNLKGLASAPQLERLFLHGRMAFGEEGVESLREHPTLRQFSWFCEQNWAAGKAAEARLGLQPLASAHRELWPFRQLNSGENQTLEIMRAGLRA